MLTLWQKESKKLISTDTGDVPAESASVSSHRQTLIRALARESARSFRGRQYQLRQRTTIAIERPLWRPDSAHARDGAMLWR